LSLRLQSLQLRLPHGSLARAEGVTEDVLPLGHGQLRPSLRLAHPPTDEAARNTKQDLGPFVSLELFDSEVRAG